MKNLSQLMEDAGIDEGQKEACQAYLDATGADDLKDFEEAYQGEYVDDIRFAQSLADELGLIDNDIQWPYTCIDWERAARDLMYDYCSEAGHYFRNL